MTTIHNNLRYLREVRDMKQRQVADALGVSRTTYTNYEAGARCPDTEMLTKMADFFELSVDELLGHTPKHSKEFRLQPRELMLVKRFRALSAAGQERTLRQMEFELALEVEQSQSQAETKSSDSMIYAPEGTSAAGNVVREKK